MRDPRIYWVDFTEEHTGQTVHTRRIVADNKMSRAELKATMIERGDSSTLKIVKVRSERID
jgi:hypothetical protein